MYTASPLHLQFTQPQIQPTMDQKNVPKKRKIAPVLNIYRLVFLAIIFSTLWYNYLHSTFIALGIVSNLKMI